MPDNELLKELLKKTFTDYQSHPDPIVLQPNPNRSTAPLNSPPQTSDLLRSTLGPDWDRLTIPHQFLGPNVASDASRMFEAGATPSDVVSLIFGKKGDVQLPNQSGKTDIYRSNFTDGFVNGPERPYKAGAEVPNRPMDPARLKMLLEEKFRAQRDHPILPRQWPY